MPDSVWDVEKVQKQFGPLKLINRGREQELVNEGKDDHILTLVSTDVAYDDLPEDERPDEEALKHLGSTKEEFSMNLYEAFVGRRLVNVTEIYESAKPMPRDLEIQDDGVWFDEDGLPPS